MPGGDANHFFRSLFNYVSTATAAQMALDNLQWILAWTWNAFDTLSGGEPGVRDGPGGPLVFGMPGTWGTSMPKACFSSLPDTSPLMG